MNVGNPLAVANFILNVIGGAEGSDQTTLVNKVTVADYFTQQMAADGFSFGSSADSVAHSAIASVTSSASSVTAAEAQSIPFWCLRACSTQGWQKSSVQLARQRVDRTAQNCCPAMTVAIGRYCCKSHFALLIKNLWALDAILE